MIGDGLVPISCYVSAETKHKLEELAEVGNIKVAAVVRDILDAAVAEDDHEQAIGASA